MELQEFLPGKCCSCNIVTFWGRDYFVRVCVVTSCVWIARLRKKRAKEISDVIKLFVSHWGAPSLLKTDVATGFAARAFKDFCEKFGIMHVLALAYIPKSNRSS